MKTFERYFFRELLFRLLATILIFSLVIAGQLLAKLLAGAAEGNYPLDVVGELFLYGTSDALIFLLPFSAMLAVTLTMGRYYRDGEAYAAFSFGIGYADFCRVLAKCVLPLTLLLFVLVMEVSPAGERRYQLLKQASKQRGDVTTVVAGNFFAPRKDTVVFVGDHDRARGTLHDLFIAKFLEEGKVIEIAKSAHQERDDDGVRYLSLHDGRLYEGRIGEEDYRVFSYREHRVPLPVNLAPRLGDDPEEMNFAALLASDSPGSRAELQRRLVTVLSLPILVLFAFSLNRVGPRRERNFDIAFVILAFLVYEHLILLLVDYVGKGKIAPLPGAWPVPAAVLASAVLMLSHRHVKRYLSGSGR